MFPLLAATGLIVFSGIVHGLWTGRWVTPMEAEASAAKLSSLPLTIGDWSGQPLELSEQLMYEAHVSSYLLRRYINRRTGHELSVFLLCGQSGPIAVHTPDVCFSGAGYELFAPYARHTIRPQSDSQEAEFWVAKFQKERSVTQDGLRVFWAWSANGVWQAPDYPRLTYARYSSLYKLYVIRTLPKLNEPLEQDPCLEFIRLLLPELQKSLFPLS
jgi:hypothetical protein